MTEIKHKREEERHRGRKTKWQKLEKDRDGDRSKGLKTAETEGVRNESQRDSLTERLAKKGQKNRKT